METEREATSNGFSNAAADTVEAWVGNTAEFAELFDNLDTGLVCNSGVVVVVVRGDGGSGQRGEGAVTMRVCSNWK